MIAINQITKERREVKISFASLQKATSNGIDQCTGPCQCTVEPDGHCSKGWPSRSLVAGII